MSLRSVYDLPTRIFHWLFAFYFLLAFIIAKTVDDESPTYVYHMLAGLTLSFLVILRIIWGFIGSKHARFSGFALKPKDLLNYFVGFLTNDKTKWAGHNPASSWAAIVMLCLALCMGITGYLMTSAGGDKEAFEDIHELFANTFIITVILHILGIAVHTLRHKELIGLSMVTGKKKDIPAEDSISSNHLTVGALLIAIVIAFSYFLTKNFDDKTKSLQIFGVTLNLGDASEGSAGAGSEDAEDEDED